MENLNNYKYEPKTIIYNHLFSMYLDAPGISSSQIKDFDKSPYHYQYFHLLRNEPKKITESMFIGSALHCAVLEPIKFNQEYTKELDPETIPNLLMTVSDLQKFCEQHKLKKTGLKKELINRILEYDHNAPIWETIQERQKQASNYILKNKTMDKILSMQDSILNNPDAAYLLKDGNPEVSVWGLHENTGQLIKCRCDWLNKRENVCIDLKTCRSNSIHQISFDFMKYGYHLQQAHYMEVLKDCVAFYFICVENEPPYITQVYQLHEYDLTLARKRYEQIMEAIKDCKKENYYPTYSKSFSVLSLPLWYEKSLERIDYE